MPHNFLIAYPQDGSRKRDLKKGIITIDFWEGEVFLDDGTKITLDTNLKNSRQEFIRSFVLYCTQGTKLRMGSEGNPVRTFSDQCNWNVYENINIRWLQVELSFTGTPDENDFQLIASTSSKAIYKPIAVKIHQHKDVAGKVTTDGEQMGSLTK